MIRFDWYFSNGLKPPTRNPLCWKLSFWSFRLLPGHWSSIATRLTTTFCGGGYNGPFREVGTPWISGRWVGGIVESSQLNIHMLSAHFYHLAGGVAPLVCEFAGRSEAISDGFGGQGRGRESSHWWKVTKPMKNNCDALVLSNDGIVLNV